MPTTIKIAEKNINLDLLFEELGIVVASVNFGLLMAGFHKLNNRVFEPNASTQVIATSTGQPDDTAEPGELRFKHSVALTVPAEDALDAALAAHNPTLLTAEQTRVDLDATEAQQLLTDYNNFDSMNAGQKDVVYKRMLRTVVRLLLSSGAEI